MTDKNKFVYEIIKPIAILAEDSKGFRKEINLISYNDKEPVVDIRVWTPQNTMSRGITLTMNAFEQLVIVGQELLNEKKEGI